MKFIKPIPGDCCALYDNFDPNCPPLLPEICKELKDLYRRRECMVTRRQRIHEMAEPIRRRPRFNPKSEGRLKRHIEYVREQPRRTRTQQLSFPLAARLLRLKKDFKHRLKNDRIEVINRNIRYSLQSMYGRLSKVLPPKPRVIIPKWTKKEWKKHRKVFKRLSRPAKPPTPPKIHRSSMPYEDMERYKELAIPIIKSFDQKEEWALSEGQRNYWPSERIIKMAQPMKRDTDTMYLPHYTPISESAKKYKATKRIKELALPRDKRQIQSDIKENPFAISPNALKYKASDRMVELAEPKEYENTHIRENPTAVSPAALKAKATPRIIELARPRVYL